MDEKRTTPMSLTFIDTNSLPKTKLPGQGEITEVLNRALCGAKNVLGSLHWLNASDRYKANAAGKHQLIYVMEGKGRITLNDNDYDVEKGGGVYLGPTESASFRPVPDRTLKLFRLVVPKIPQ
jgi:quercetin dioxygenase-like cupin family protein